MHRIDRMRTRVEQYASDDVPSVVQCPDGHWRWFCRRELSCEECLPLHFLCLLLDVIAPDGLRAPE